MNRRIVAAPPRFLLERFLFWTLAAIVAMALASPVRAAGNAVDSIVVKFQDGVVAPNAASVPMEAMSRLLLAIGAPFAVSGQTRDGAFTLQLAAPLDQDGARAALNAIRLERSVLYASIAPGAPTPATTGLPTDRIIVKYRDPALIANAQAGFAAGSGSAHPLDRACAASLWPGCAAATMARTCCRCCSGCPSRRSRRSPRASPSKPTSTTRSPTTSGPPRSFRLIRATRRPALAHVPAATSGTSSIRSAASTCPLPGISPPARPASTWR